MDTTGFTQVVSKKKHIIDSLLNYMFTSKMMRNTIRGLERDVPSPKSSSYKHKFHRNVFVPKSGDTLFWVFYILVNGVDTYELLGNNIFLTEKNEKIKNIEIIKKNRAKLKEHGIKKHVTCENDLLNESTIELKTFHALCICYDIDFMFLKNRVYYLHIVDDEVECDNKNVCPVVHELGDGVYGFESTTHADVFKNYMDTRMRMENYEKPIKSVTSYTLSHLREMCETLKIKTINDDGSTKTKANMYADLTFYLCD